jgi:hypothetical protein
MAEPQMKKGRGCPPANTSGFKQQNRWRRLFLVGAASTIRRINRDLDGVIFIAARADIDVVLSAGTEMHSGFTPGSGGFGGDGFRLRSQNPVFRKPAI